MNMRSYVLTSLSTLALVIAPYGAVAGTKTVSLERVSNFDIVCDPADPDYPQNCLLDEIQKVSCPAGELPKSITVQVGPGSMETCIDATNTSTSDSCYSILEIEHLNLKLRVDPEGLDVELNGPLNNTACPEDGSGNCLTEAPTCNSSYPDDGRFLFRRAAGADIDVCTILESSKAALAPVTYTPEDPEWDTFYGTGPIGLEFSANADVVARFSGTWDGGVRTDARATVTITPDCDVEETPATSPLGIGALLVGLSGLGAFLGFRRRRS